MSNQEKKTKDIFFDESSSHKDHKWLPDNKYIFIISILSLAAIIIWIVERPGLAHEKFKLLLRGTPEKINLILILCFVIFSFTFFGKDSFMLKATKTGLYAMVIAICAFLEIPLMPFWITHVMVYFSQDILKVD